MTETNPTSQTNERQPQKESLWANLLLNIVIPTLILTKLSGDDWLGTKWAIVIALIFPLAYGLRDLTQSGKVNFFSALGIISILLTGGISLLELDAQYIAIKEAAIPGLLGIATVASLYTRWPLVKTLLYNDRILDTEKIARTLAVNGNQTAFERTLQQASWMIACSFFLSSALNYILAKLLLQSPPGTEAFNEELGKMTALSFPVIALPATIILMLVLFFLFRRIGKLTGLKLEEIMVQQ
ncbi:VC0807 family protein [Microbulbifer thermotolerans]|uniref:MFS transporter n=1 Tax=Microbulbifer thermotolerans TaxID=252514 RepID=A0A143HLQ4_MICTH|nr:VC0807 family protein [Microbulbifer thermotolerans]AMX02202.1 MFS transporter [Microbulbifer thermotolerans]MCX2778827.1 MFS transporter [Microbulbifer thermotolerans]MCX2781901.1 MFS transporter [Microbulbifer thermotolerans]MCX2793713.1 MFS transporter [Microbulbifer thermotolerans]MCX2800897.1 MFS transporter [Microbulbifer thermotolerans]